MSFESRDYLEMTFRSISCFANDGKLLVDELQEIVDIALRDGVVDDNEKRVLKSIIDKLDAMELTGEMFEKIQQLRCAHGF
jgi:hypothetical protein